MIDENKDQRKDIEEKAWEDINKIKEQNKEDLRVIIDAGIESKKKLTEVQGKLKQAQNAKTTLD